MAENIFKQTHGPLGSIGSVYNADMGKPVTVKDNKNKNTSSGLGLGLEKESLPTPTLTLLKQMTTDEVTLSSKYYPASQPFLVQFLIQFPKKVAKTSSEAFKFVADYADNADDILEVRPNNLINFSANEKPQGIGTFSMTLFDPQWNKIESKIVKNKGLIRIRWGYADQGSMLGNTTENTTATPWIDCFITSYSLKFGLQGTTISIAGIMVGYKMVFTKEYKAFGEGGQLISDIVIDIAKNSGLKPVVEPTLPILVMSDLKETQKAPKIFIKKGETNLSLIMNELQPYATSAISKEGDYQFYIKRPMKKGELPELHFHTIHYFPPENNIPTFTLFKTPNSPVIDYSPIWEATIANIIGANDTFSVIIDASSKNINPYTPSIKTVPQPYDNSIAGTTFLKIDEVYDGKQEDLNTKIISFETVNYPDLHPEEQQALMHTKISKSAKHVIRASLTIQGITNFSLTDLIGIAVYIPGNASKAHWTSGFFRILGIVHSISAGSYTTKLDLCTAGNYMDGVEILPRTDSKK